MPDRNVREGSPSTHHLESQDLPSPHVVMWTLTRPESEQHQALHLPFPQTSKTPSPPDKVGSLSGVIHIPWGRASAGQIPKLLSSPSKMEESKPRTQGDMAV